MTRRAPSPVGSQASAQDRALEEHLLSFIAGAGGEYGPEAADELRAIFAKMRREDRLSVGGYLVQLVQADAASRGW